MEKILVTGATGFIGNYVVEALLSAGYAVIATSVHEQRARTASWWGKAKYIPFDLAYFDANVDHYAKFDLPHRMIHLAWEGLPRYKEDFHLSVNYPRHAVFLKNLLDHGLRNLTVIGTCLEYGKREGCLSEDLPPQPGNAYALAKDQLRLFLEKEQKNTSFALHWVRLFYLYGKGQGPNSLLSQLDKALDNGDAVFNMSPGNQTRDYLPVEKAADLISRIAVQDKVTGIINCCSGKPIAVKELVLQHMTERNKFVPLNPGFYPYPDYEPMHFWGDVTKLKSIL